MENTLTREENFIIIDNDKCPCGSGKPYKECCKKHNYEYNTLGKNYEGKEIIFNQSLNMKIYDDIVNYAMDNIFSLNGQPVLMVSKALDMLKEIYIKVDKGINQFSQYAPCKKGCGSCCSLYLECTDIEAELIRRYINETRTPEEIDALNKKVKIMLETIATTGSPHVLQEKELDKLYLNYASKRKSCIFLNEDKSCSIYEVRPLSCRKFLVFTSAENCSLKEEIVTPSLAPGNIGRLAVDNLSMVVGKYKNLNYLDGQDMKPIMKSLIQWFKNGFDDISKNK